MKCCNPVGSCSRTIKKNLNVGNITDKMNGHLYDQMVRTAHMHVTVPMPKNRTFMLIFKQQRHEISPNEGSPEYKKIGLRVGPVSPPQA